jgi:short-subunit dehydrogenase
MSLPPPSPHTTSVVTGASSGIGAEIARQLAARGRGVTLVARRELKLLELAEALQARYGVRAEVITADLTDPDARANLATELETRGLRADVLVNNAGFTTWGPVHKGAADRDIGMIRTDVEAVAHLCSLFLPGMVEHGEGVVLNVASTAAFQPLRGQAGYAASKAFVLSYSQAIGAELHGTGVSVTVLCPGPVETGFAEAVGISDDEAANSLPRFMWVPVADVAKAAVEGMDKGRSVVIHGVANQAGSLLGHLTPRTLLLPLLSRQHPALKE